MSSPTARRAGPQLGAGSIDHRARIARLLAELQAGVDHLHPYEQRYLANLLDGVAQTYVRRAPGGCR